MTTAPVPRHGMRLRDALPEHLRARGLPTDSGVSLRWIWIRFLGVPIAFPNFDARRAILVTHDVHHLLTGYPTTWRGEAEIGAWELTTGCRRFWAAWFFNFGGFLFGLVIAPRAMWHAFVRGRHCTNFYGVDAAALLQRTVGAARAELGLDRTPPPPTCRDGFAFLGWILLVVTTGVALPVGGLMTLVALAT